MKKIPTIGKFLDDDEKAIYEAIESDDYKVGENFLTPERMKELKAAARATMNETRVKISLRLPETDLARLKAKAMREGMPYQTPSIQSCTRPFRAEKIRSQKPDQRKSMEPKLTEIVSGLAFPEGPVYLPDGSLIIVELAAGSISRITRDGRKLLIAKPGGSPNGAAMGPDGYLYVCNSGGFAWERRGGLLYPVAQAEDYSGGRIERVDIETGKLEVIYNACDGHALRGPNDLVFDGHGGFYFTDHGKRRPREIDCGGLYYASTNGSLIHELAYPLNTPNGVGLSPDETEVYVAETDTGHLWAFDIVAPGRLRKVAPHGGRYLGGPPGFTCYDSMALEAGGNLCVASLVYGGITVVARDGRFIEFVPLPDPLCTNLCFGGIDLRTAYVTLSGAGRLVSLPWPRPGHRLNY